MKSLIVILIVFSSCASKQITGRVEAVKGDTVYLGKYQFQVKGNLPKVGDTVSFKPTVKRKKINSRKL